MSEKKGLERIVPPLGLCKLIPDGAFADSALAWWGDQFFKTHRVAERNRVFDAVFLDAISYPAPTLAEIMDDLLLKTNDCEPTLLWQGGWHVQCAGKDGYDMTSAAAAAIRLWLKVNGVEVKDE